MRPLARVRGPLALLVTGLVCSGTASSTAAPATRAGLPIQGTSCTVFPVDNVWHADISHLPVNAHSTAWLAHMDTTGRSLHPDFGPSYGAQPVPYGIPVTVVAGTHPMVRVRFTYASESDNVPYPLGADTKIEGGATSTGDRHAVIVDAATCRLYETWDTRDTSRGWTAGAGATWSLASDALRPAGWTSADAAGLPILAGLLRYQEVAAGQLDHAIRFTAPVTCTGYLWPARHEAGSTSDCADYPPMGARFRLAANFNLSGYRPDTQVVLRAMQKYGLILADNGSAWFFQGTAENDWPSGLLDQLKTIPASAFQAVDESSLMISPNSGAAR